MSKMLRVSARLIPVGKGKYRVERKPRLHTREPWYPVNGHIISRADIMRSMVYNAWQLRADKRTGAYHKTPFMVLYLSVEDEFDLFKRTYNEVNNEH